MTVDRSTQVFFDASCLIAAVGSPSGGSSFLPSLCAQGLLHSVVSQPVILEAERNIAAKLGVDALHAFRRLVLLTPLDIVAVPNEAERRGYRQMVGEKDEHVAAAAVASHSSFLLTLDKKLSERINAGGLPIRALSPGDFIRTQLPTHPEYPTE